MKICFICPIETSLISLVLSLCQIPSLLCPYLCDHSSLNTYIPFHSLIQFSFQTPHCCFTITKNVTLFQILSSNIYIPRCPLGPNTHIEVLGKKCLLVTGMHCTGMGVYVTNTLQNISYILLVAFHSAESSGFCHQVSLLSMVLTREDRAGHPFSSHHSARELITLLCSESHSTHRQNGIINGTNLMQST